MTALFTSPMAFTVVGANQQGTTAGNAALDEPARVWRSASLTTPYIIVDLGAAVASYDTIGVIGTNLRGSDTVQVRTGTTTSGIGSYAGSALPTYSGVKPVGFSTKSVQRIPLQTARYVRIDLASAGNPDGYTSVQRIVIGKALTTSGIDYNAEHSVIDDSTVTPNMGVDIIEEAQTRLRWKFSMGWVDAVSWETDWLSFLSSVKTVRPVLFIPFVEDVTKLQAQAVFGRIRKSPIAKLISINYRSVDIEIEGMAP